MNEKGAHVEFHLKWPCVLG